MLALVSGKTSKSGSHNCANRRFAFETRRKAAGSTAVQQYSSTALRHCNDAARGCARLRATTAIQSRQGIRGKHFLNASTERKYLLFKATKFAPIMTITHWLLFCGVSLLMCFTPGPAVLLAISNSVDVGARRTAFSSLGSSAGIFVISALAMIGMGTILSLSANAFLVMKVAGAMYLIWLGVKRWRSKDGLFSSEEGLAPSERRERKNWQLAAQGLTVSLTNPKSILFFSALFPQFIVPGAPLLTQYLLLTTTFVICALISHAFYVALISVIKGHVVARAKLFNRIVGGTFIALGLSLLKTRHKLG